MGGTKTTAPPNALTLYTGPGEVVGGITFPNNVNVTASGIATNSLFVAWDPPNDIFVTSGGHIEVQYQLSGASTWTPAGKVSGDSDSFFINGVTDGSAYNVRIQAVNVVGVASPWVQAGPETVTASTSTLISGGLSPNIPYNISNTATIDSILDVSGTTASIRVYGPGGVGTSWDQITGAGTVTFAATDITGCDLSTVYYVCINNSLLDHRAGGLAYDYLVFTDYNETLSDYYVSVGSTVTVAAGGTGGTSGGGSWHRFGNPTAITE
jgi:hypothetical protein